MNNAKRKTEIISFEEFFSYRNLWMSIAILWIVLYHSEINLSGLFNAIQKVGYGGTDIFLFASGIGCCHSLNRQDNIKKYLLRRIDKILPMQILFLFIFIIYSFLLNSIGPLEIIGNLFGLGFFARLDNQFNWYLSAMWACYLLAPIFKSIISEAKPGAMILIFLGLCVASLSFVNQFQLIFWSRLPIFFLGMATAELSRHKAGFTIHETIALLVFMLLGLISLALFYSRYYDYLWPYGLWWYPFILITPGLTLLISLIAKFISGSKLKIIVSVLDKLGQNTLPVYLSHIFIFDLFNVFYSNHSLPRNLTSYFLSLFVMVLFALALNYSTVFIKNIIKHNKLLQV